MSDPIKFIMFLFHYFLEWYPLLQKLISFLGHYKKPIKHDLPHPDPAIRDQCRVILVFNRDLKERIVILIIHVPLSRVLHPLHKLLSCLFLIISHQIRSHQSMLFKKLTESLIFHALFLDLLSVFISRIYWFSDQSPPNAVRHNYHMSICFLDQAMVLGISWVALTDHETQVTHQVCYFFMDFVGRGLERVLSLKEGIQRFEGYNRC